MNKVVTEKTTTYSATVEYGPENTFDYERVIDDSEFTDNKLEIRTKNLVIDSNYLFVGDGLSGVAPVNGYGKSLDFYGQNLTVNSSLTRAGFLNKYASVGTYGLLPQTINLKGAKAKKININVSTVAGASADVGIGFMESVSAQTDFRYAAMQDDSGSFSAGLQNATITFGDFSDSFFVLMSPSNYDKYDPPVMSALNASSIYLGDGNDTAFVGVDGILDDFKIAMQRSTLNLGAGDDFAEITGRFGAAEVLGGEGKDALAITSFNRDYFLIEESGSFTYLLDKEELDQQSATAVLMAKIDGVEKLILKDEIYAKSGDGWVLDNIDSDNDGLVDNVSKTSV